MHVVDVSGSEGRDPVEDFEAICAELENYSIDLSNRPMIVAANKCDLLPPDSDNLTRLRSAVEAAGCEMYEISAGTTQGTKALMRVVAERLRTLPPVTIYEPEYVAPVPEAGNPAELTIEHLGNTWLITGTWLERLIQNINFDDYESGIILIYSSESADFSPVWRKWAFKTGVLWIFMIFNSIINDRLFIHKDALLTKIPTTAFMPMWEL